MKLQFRAFVAAAMLLSGPVLRAADSRPNFIFIYTDDQRYDAIGVVQREQGDKGRFPWFKTPNMDRLAAEGVRFRNAFASSSLCSPSRAAFLTGLYNHLNGVVNNHTPFPTNSVTYATVLRAAGYKTGYIGKWHMGNQHGQRPGFDYSASYIAHGRYEDCPFEINGLSQPTKGWVDDVTTDFALEFMRTNKSGPFVLVVGFKSPHDPRTPPDRLKNAFAGESLRRAVNQEARPAYLEGTPNPYDKLALDSPHLLDYFRCIAGADENLGRILGELDKLGLADNTMVVYSSDNGYYLGDHGLGDKRSAYEESIRIPLLLRYPKLGVKGVTIDEPVLNIDFAPTLIDYAGMTPPGEMQGRSWRPLLERKGPQPPPEWRTSFFYEYFHEKNFNVPTLFAVRTMSAKLIKYKDHDAWTELFDLLKDPYEMTSLWSNSAAAPLRSMMETEYDRQKQNAAFVFPAYDSDDEVEAPPAKSLNAWVVDYHFDHDDGDTVMDASAKSNNGHAKNAPLADGTDNSKSRRFKGNGYISIPKSASLNPSRRDWTIEIKFKADAPDGILLAHGGGNSGYCLALAGGKPVFTVVNQKKTTTVTASEPALSGWTTVRAGIVKGFITLSVNGGSPTQVPFKTGLVKNPLESVQVGDDLGSAVLGESKPPPFTGLIQSVRIYDGQAP